jgi:hypothetical protein
LLFFGHIIVCDIDEDILWSQNNYFLVPKVVVDIYDISFQKH